MTQDITQQTRRARLTGKSSLGDSPSEVRQRVSQEETIASQQQTIDLLTRRLAAADIRMGEMQELLAQLAADKLNAEQALLDHKNQADKPSPSEKEWAELSIREQRASRNIATGSRHFQVAYHAFKEADKRKKEAEANLAKAADLRKEVAHLLAAERAKFMQRIAHLEGLLAAERTATQAAQERANHAEAECKELEAEFRSYLEADRANAQQNYQILIQGVRPHVR